MTSRHVNIAVYGILAAVAAGTFLLPGTLTIPDSRAASSDTVRLSGVVRDFSGAHSDFNVVPAGGKGHYAGTVSRSLDDRGRPAFVPVSDRLTNFSVVNQIIVPGSDFAIQLAVLGAEIYSGSYHRPVTMELHVGSDVFTPFGAFNTPVDSNLNNDQTETGWVNPGSNPRSGTPGSMFPSGTSVAVVGKSWQKVDSGDSGLENAHWETKLAASTADNGDQIRVLVNGDPVPDITGDFDQSSAADYVRDYIDYDTGTIALGDHQAIFLFELANTSGTGDYQDLVVLMSLAEDTAYFEDGTIGGQGSPTGGYKVAAQWTDDAGQRIAPHLYETGATDACGDPIDDAVGARGVVDSGGITSSETFSDWFRDKPGVNLSAPLSIDLVDTGSGVYEFVTSAFHPIDGRLLGDETDAHNTHFTFSFTAEFVYEACTGQYVDFGGGDGAWAYINDQLALDLGGVGATDRQRVDLDRLGLVDGETYSLDFFYAQRDPLNADFELRTNILFAQADTPSLISSAFD